MSSSISSGGVRQWGIRNPSRRKLRNLGLSNVESDPQTSAGADGADPVRPCCPIVEVPRQNRRGALQKRLDDEVVLVLLGSSRSIGGRCGKCRLNFRVRCGAGRQGSAPWI